MFIAARLAMLMLAAGGELSHDESVREELRVGDGIAVNAPSDEVSATEVIILNLSALWAWRDNQLSAGYNPTFQLPDFPHLGFQGFEDLQVGHLADSYQDRSGHNHFSVAEDFQYGTTDIFTLTQVSSSSSPQVQAVPVTTALDYVSSSALARFQSELTPRLKLDLSGGYQVSGGSDAASQVQLPLQEGPVASAVMENRVTHLDTLTTTFTGLESDFSNDQRIWLGEATESWSRRFNRVFQARLDLGWGVLSERYEPRNPSILSERFETETSGVDNFPVARLTLTDNQTLSGEGVLVLSLSSEMAPYIDRVAAIGYEHFQVLGIGDWTVWRGFGASLQAGYTDPLYGEVSSAEAVLTTSGHVYWEPKKYLRLEAGAIGIWQQPPGASLLVQWVTYAAIVLRNTGTL